MARDIEKVRAARRRWYKNNAAHAKEKVYERRAEIKNWYDSIKATLKCSSCGEDHPSCLEFHHNNPLEKEKNVCEAINNGWSKEHILLEISRCTVLCANCHKKLHYERTG